MELKILFLCFLVALHRVHCQECRVVSICNDQDEISNSGRNLNTGNTKSRGEKGDRGVPGKGGLLGIRGPPGEKGNKGVKGESSSTNGVAADLQLEMRIVMADFHRSLSLLKSKLRAANKKIDGLIPPVDCSQSDKDGSQLLSSGERVYCHQHWRVIQHRFNGQVIFHNKTWNEYKNGFGSLSTEFWIGLDQIHHLTRNRRCRLRVVLGAFDGSEAYAEFRDFSIGSESDLFRLHISGHSGTAGDSMTLSSNRVFTTVDRDNDGMQGNCASYGRGAWWYGVCGYAFLNGRWGENLDTQGSFTYFEWKDAYITLKSNMMMIRCD